MEEAANMPSSTQEFCLRWNNFHASLVSAIDGFKNDSDFVDVTLACEGQFIQAHKMLLSACSVFFRDLLKANPCQHPIVILPPDVQFGDLEKMLRFIYQGEVNVQQEHLARFLKTAEMLKIRGLVEDNEKQKILPSSSSAKACSSEGSESERSVDNVSVIPKRPRLSVDPPSCSISEVTQTTNDENSQGSGLDSDSEMIPVKQEMIEFKECDFENVECESLFSDTLIKITSATTSSSDTSSSTHPAPPPPPGLLLPSYVPPTPQVKSQDGHSRSSSHPVGGLIRQFLEECLQLPDPAPLLSTYSGLEGTPHFQLMRSVAKEWSYCRNATQNYSCLGGSNKRQRATSRLIETFENIDSLRNQLAQNLHSIIVIEVTMSGTVNKICKAEQSYVQQQQLAQQQAAQQQGNNGENAVNVDVINRDFVIMDIEGVTTAQQEEFKKATDVMRQLRKLYFDQSRRLAVRISQLKKGRQQTQDRMHRHHYQQQQQQQHSQPQQSQSQQAHQNIMQQIQQQQNSQQHLQQHPQQLQQQNSQAQLQQQQSQHLHQHQVQINPDGSLHLPHHSQLSLHHLHQPWSD